MKKQYEEYADVVNGFISLFDKDVKEAEDAANKVMIDWRFSPAGRESAKDDICKDLEEKADRYTVQVKDVAKRFCDTYSVKLPNDNKDHAMDVANALKIIDMLGFGLTPETLKTILEPVKNSYQHLKMIFDVINAKADMGYADTAGLSYSPAIFATMHEYLGLNTKVLDYLDAYKRIEEVATNDACKLVPRVMKFDGATSLTITPVVPYAMLGLPDAMISTGEMYAALEDEFSALFTMHTPTDHEIIESTLKNQ